MNNDLEQFSEERLKEIAAGGFKSLPNFNEAMALARIALAAKQAEVVAYITYKGHLLHAADPKVAEHSDPQPLYDSPPANSPAIPDGWISCSESLPNLDGNYWGWWSESRRQGPVWFTKGKYHAAFQSYEITHWMPLPAAPKPESE